MLETVVKEALAFVWLGAVLKVTWRVMRRHLDYSAFDMEVECVNPKCQFNGRAYPGDLCPICLEIEFNGEKVIAALYDAGWEQMPSYTIDLTGDDPWKN